MARRRRLQTHGFACGTNEISVTNGVISVEKSPPDYGELFYVNSSTGEVLPHVVPTELDLDGQERVAEWVRPCWKPGTEGPPDSVAELAWESVWVNIPHLPFVLGMDNREQIRVGAPDRAPRLGSCKGCRAGLETSMGNIAASLSRAALLSSNQSVYVTICQVLLGGCFLLLTIHANRRQHLHLWKSSILAVLFHGLDKVESVDPGTRYDTVHQMECTSEQIRVRLKKGSQQRGLVLNQA
ncbi:hypothetical protein BJX62DRAFT_245404 [Aspergillus germanicus]